MAQSDAAFDEYRLDIPLEDPLEGLDERLDGGAASGGSGEAGPSEADRPSIASVALDVILTPIGIAVIVGLATLASLAAAGRRRQQARLGRPRTGRRGRRSTMLGALLAMTAVAATGCGGGAGASDDPFFGVQPRSNPEADDFARMADAGVGTYRVFVSWVDVQKEADAPFDWSRVDPVMVRLAFNDIEPLVYFAGVPGWLADDRRDSPVASQRSREAVGAFIAAAVGRYGPDSTFWRQLQDSELELTPKPVRTWQIWNEQNSSFAWRPKASVDEYRELLTIAATAIRSVDPDARIMSGGMFGTPPARGSIKSWRFARELLSDAETRELVDVVGIHPYSPSIDGVRFQVREVRKALADSGAADLPLWVTEIGWGSSERGGLMVGLQGQAEMLTEAFSMFERNRERWILEGVVWFSWRDDRRLPGRNVFDGSSGLLTDAGEAKPAFGRYRDAAAGD